MGEVVQLAAAREARAAPSPRMPEGEWRDWGADYARAYLKTWLERAMRIGEIAERYDQPLAYRRAARLLAWIWRERLRHPLVLELAAEAAQLWAERSR